MGSGDEEHFDNDIPSGMPQQVQRNINPPTPFTIEYNDPADNSGRRVRLTKEDRLAILFDLHGVKEYFVIADTEQSVHSSKFNEQPKEQSNVGLFDQDWVCNHGKQEHDFFISYRVKTDGPNAEKLALELMADEQRPHAYLDKRCLVPGRPFKEGFLNGLKRSRVIVLLISSGALKGVRDAHKYADNMLLEWEHALEDLKASSMTKVIIPLLVATENDDASFRKFTDFDTTVYADEFPAHPQSTRKHTVREIMRKIFENQGIHYIPQDDENRSSVRARLLRELAKVRSGNPPSNPTSSPRENLHPSRSYNLTATEDHQLRQWLKPLDEEMSKEQEDASKRHLRGTRVWLLKQILQWCQGEREERLLWLQGQAGMGKTVVAGYVAEELLKRNLLGSAYFFKYNVTNRADPSSLIRTLTYNLTKWSTNFAIQLLEIHRQSPEVIDSALSKVFAKLILEPLTSIKESQPKPVVLVIDALDECGIIGSRQEILHILASECNQLPHFVKIILTSRPEEDIVASFDDMKTKKLEPTHDENMADIRMYSEHIFRRKWHLQGQALEQVVTKFTESSGGVFAWVKYVEETLEQRLAAASSGGTATQDIIQDLVDHALSLPGDMSELYDKSFRDDIWLDPKVIKVLHTLATLSDPLTPSGISQLLEWDEDEVNKALRNIQPLLSIDPSTQIVRFFHKSVYDYLSDATTCTIPRLLLDARKMNSELAMRCIWLMNKRLSRNLCSLPHDVLHENIPHFRDRVTTSIPLGGGLRYACLRWTGHVQTSFHDIEVGSSSQDSGLRNTLVAARELYKAIEMFLLTHIHHWFEALSLLESFPGAVLSLLQLDEFWQASIKADPALSTEFPSLSTMVYDGRRFAQTFGYPVTRCAQQVYISALPLCPTDRLISNLERSLDLIDNNNQPRHDMKILLGREKTWSPCLMTLFGHQRRINSVAMTPDGRYVVTGSGDETAKIWDLTSGKEVRELRGHEKWVEAVAVTPDARHVVTGSGDDTAKVWDLASGKEVRELRGHQGTIKAVAITPDGRYVVTGSIDGTAKIWDFASAKEMRELRGHEGWVHAVAVTPDGRNVVTGSADGTAIVWELASGRDVCKLGGHEDEIYAVAVSPDGQHVVTGSKDTTAKVWDFASGKELRELRGHHEWVNAVAITPDGLHVVTGSIDGTAIMWDLPSGTEVGVFYGHEDWIMAVAVTPDARYLVTGSQDNTAKVWDIRLVLSDKKVPALPTHQDQVRAVAVTADGRYVATGSNDCTAKLWDLESGDEVGWLFEHQNWVSAVAFTPDGKHLVTAAGNTVVVWDLASGEEVCELRGHRQQVNAVAVTLDGRYVVTGSNEGVAKVWDLASGTVVHELCGRRGLINAVAVAPNGKHVVTGSWDDTAKVWDLQSGKEVHELRGHTSVINTVSVTPDGRNVVTGSLDGTARVWDLASGKEVCELPLTDSEILIPSQHLGVGVNISSDGWIRLLGSSDKIVGWIPLPKGAGCATSDGGIVLAGQNHLMHIRLGWDRAGDVDGFLKKQQVEAEIKEGKVEASLDGKGEDDRTLREEHLHEEGEMERVKRAKLDEPCKEKCCNIL